MIYYLDSPVVWDKKLKKAETRSQVEQIVYDEITAIRNKYFSDNATGRVKLLYPNGKPKEKDGGFTIMKRFPIQLWSSDGAWRWTSARKPQNGEYVDHHVFLRHDTVFTEKDIEFLWFLMNRSSALNKFIFVEDLEAESKKINEQMASDADIRFMLLSNKSPIAKDETTIKQLAEVFGVKDTRKKGIEQIKKELYDVLVEGEKSKDKFTNYNKFDELAGGDVKRKAAFNAKRAINDGIVKYKDYAWWIMSGSVYDEQLVKMKPADSAYREQVFVDEIVNNAGTRSRLFAALGIEEITTTEDLRDMGRTALMNRCKDLGIKTEVKDDTEALVKKLCTHYNIEYLPKE